MILDYQILLKPPPNLTGWIRPWPGQIGLLLFEHFQQYLLSPTQILFKSLDIVAV